MDERLKFIARLLDGEKMAVLCRQFGISRKTGYKILTRYSEIGLEGLTDRSRRPYRHANQLPFQIETQIVRLKQDRPSWRAPVRPQAEHRSRRPRSSRHGLTASQAVQRAFNSSPCMWTKHLEQARS
jgi:hypothetical protein